MQIYFERSGGFAGIRFQTRVDTDELPPHEANPLIEMVSNANFFELPQSLTNSGHSSDRFQYRLTITDGDRSHTVEINGAAVPGDLQPLLQQLTTLARGQKRGSS
jgi:hypothetical protein